MDLAGKGVIDLSYPVETVGPLATAVRAMAAALSVLCGGSRIGACVV